jgi:hypothetical protein
MKNQRKPSIRPFAPAVTISAMIDDQILLEEFVKYLACGRNKMNYSGETVQEGWKAIDSSSLEAYVSGNMIISTDDEPISLAYTTGFLFTCIKENHQDYSLEGSFSLS